MEICTKKTQNGQNLGPNTQKMQENDRLQEKSNDQKHKAKIAQGLQKWLLTQ